MKHAPGTAFVISLDSIAIRADVPLVERLTEEQSLWANVELSSDEETQQLRERLEPYLDMIPELEAKIVDMRLRGVSEHVIAKHYGGSQAAISYRLTRGIKRLQFHINRPPRPDSLYEDVLAVTSGSKNPQRMTVGVVTFADEASWKLASIATNQSITHGNVRSWVIRVLNRLPDGPAKAYIQYSFERAGIKHENMAGKGGPGSLGKKTKGKL